MSEHQKEVGNLCIKLSEFLRKQNPNPFVVVCALEIAKHQFLIAIDEQFKEPGRALEE